MQVLPSTPPEVANSVHQLLVGGLSLFRGLPEAIKSRQAQEAAMTATDDDEDDDGTIDAKDDVDAAPDGQSSP